MDPRKANPRALLYAAAGALMVVCALALVFTQRGCAGPVASPTPAAVSIKKIEKTEQSRETTRAVTHAKQTVREREKTRVVTTEKLDPLTGKVVERKTDRTTIKKIDETKAADSVVDSQKTETAVAHIEERIEVAIEQPKQAVGFLFTGQGAGVAYAYNLANYEQRVHLDAVAGVVLVTPSGQDGPSPRLGLQGAMRILPSLTAGVGVYLAPAGDPLGRYHPALPGVGVAPGLTVQYRF